MKLIYVIFVSTLFFNLVTAYAGDSTSKSRQLIKLSLIDFTTHRAQYEVSPIKYLSFGLGASYSPNGYYGNSPKSQWYGVAPFGRVYARKDKAKGLYFEASLPIYYFNDFPVMYESLASYQNGSMFFSSYGKLSKTVYHSFTSVGAGASVGAQFRVYKRFYLDLGLGFEQFIRPDRIKKNHFFAIDEYSTNTEEYKIVDTWASFLTGRFYFGYQLFRD